MSSASKYFLTWGACIALLTAFLYSIPSAAGLFPMDGIDLGRYIRSTWITKGFTTTSVVQAHLVFLLATLLGVGIAAARISQSDHVNEVIAATSYPMMMTLIFACATAFAFIASGAFLHLDSSRIAWLILGKSGQLSEFFPIVSVGLMAISENLFFFSYLFIKRLKGTENVQ